MLRTISFEFETQRFQVQLDVIQKKEDELSESDPSLLFLKFLKEMHYIKSLDEIFLSSGYIKFFIISNDDTLKSNEIKEKAKSLGLPVIPLA